jgi:hypothetical protein
MILSACSATTTSNRWVHDMSYSKITDTIPDIASVVALALAQNGVSEPIADALLDAGQAVQLETGDKVWVSCVVHDRAETPQVDFITIGIACRPDVTPWVKPNGQLVASVFWSGVWPDCLAALGIDTVRRALLMVALGEPQPQVPIPNPDPEPAPQEQDAIPGIAATSHSIRTAITAGTELSAPVADVL